MNKITPPSGGSVFVPAKSVDPEQLMKFAAAVWPERPAERVLATWWRRAAPDCAIAAVNQTTGRMVGVCAGIPCEWVICGRIFPATAICDWYVVPDQEGKLLGRHMIRRYDVPDRVVYGFSMSQPAVVYMNRLGWEGPSAASLLAMPLPRLMRLLPLARRAGLELDLHLDDVAGRLPARVETACFRLVQEALTNVVRHSGARRVTVELVAEPDTVRVEVRDDGKGFDVRAARGTSQGLSNMHERAALAGGELRIESGTGKGTTVRASFPVTEGGTP